MVRLWPWRGDDASPASFEKILSALSTKISKSQQQLDTLRQRSRRFKALWTLYTSFAYLLCAIILALVVGWQNWDAWEYSAVAGSPLFIYLVRAGIAKYYAYRIDVVTFRLEEQHTERTKTIDKLKAATKYNSTQQLLDKYGGATSQPKPKRQGSPARLPRRPQKQPQRTNIPPPATANIPGNLALSSSPSILQSIPPQITLNRLPPRSPGSPLSTSQAGAPEFAPNAFGSVPQYDYNTDPYSDGKWYDRILDLLLGEDETAPKNRLVLICKHCRLVNGQAPPGIKHIEELGKWRCMACGEWNGEVYEGVKIVEEINKQAEIEAQDRLENVEEDKEAIKSSSEDDLREREGEEFDEQDDEEISGEIVAQKEPVQKIRSGRRKGTGKEKS